ncbi:MAG TPA: ATPase domain-containing protein, partial [Bryobacteraceae bacterium]|nr:ATPase domain-containing protein [Bryobacteraceae bacterium]
MHDGQGIEPSGEVRVRTGVSGLDSILDGGLPEDHLYLLEGDPGSGKTTLALQFLLEARRRGESVLYVTLSESIRELRAIARSHGWSLEGLEIFEVIPPPESLLPEDQYTVYHPGDVELGNTLKSILERVDAIKPTKAVFDSLSEIRLLSRDSARYRRQILGLKQFFESRHCTTLLLDDRPRHESSETAVLSIVHGVIRLERMTREYGARRRRLEVTKLRGVKYHDGFHDYDISTGGLVVYPRLATMKHTVTGIVEGSASGIPELDQLLGGGLDRGTSTLLAGPAGSGKSSIALQYATAAASRGEETLIYLFDEGLNTLHRRASGLGLPVTELAATGRLRIHQLDPAE